MRYTSVQGQLFLRPVAQRQGESVASPCRFMPAFRLLRRHGIGIERLDTITPLVGGLVENALTLGHG